MPTNAMHRNCELIDIGFGGERRMQKADRETEQNETNRKLRAVLVLPARWGRGSVARRISVMLLGADTHNRPDEI